MKKSCITYIKTLKFSSFLITFFCILKYCFISNFDINNTILYIIYKININHYTRLIRVKIRLKKTKNGKFSRMQGQPKNIWTHFLPGANTRTKEKNVKHTAILQLQKLNVIVFLHGVCLVKRISKLKSVWTKKTSFR